MVLSANIIKVDRHGEAVPQLAWIVNGDDQIASPAALIGAGQYWSPDHQFFSYGFASATEALGANSHDRRLKPNGDCYVLDREAARVIMP
jgi:hypothetical protein